MNSVYDLHSHSTASDGTLEPRELVQKAAQAGVDVLALTDHDTVDGIDEAAAEAPGAGIALVAGVEISVTWNKQLLHIVGLGVDTGCETLREGLRRLQRVRGERAEEMGRMLEKQGIEGAYAGARALANGRVIGRSHFARFLVDEGHVATMRKVFRSYLGHGKPGFVASEWATLEEAVSWIHAAGGQAVVAHPARYPFSITKLKRVLQDFIEIGGEGLEVISGSHSREDNANMARLAREFGLLASMGSDYHGPECPWLSLGRLAPMPEGLTPIWHDWQERGIARSA
jgi:predicted metal-dependent phosphoesterase TrpH